MTEETREKLKAEKDRRISELEKELSEGRTELEEKNKEHDIFVKKMAATKSIIEKLFAATEWNSETC